MKMNKLAIILCLNLFALPSYAAQNKSNIIIDKPKATNPIVNGQNYGTNTIIGTVPTFSGSNNVILGSGNTATLNSTAIGEIQQPMMLQLRLVQHLLLKEKV
ncbi:hypothetical protein Q8W17_13220 [Photobacterium damselae subsp. piscicida]|nr:hypothetical protein [Photobacterium damselae subsp. piscicida]